MHTPVVVCHGNEGTVAIPDTLHSRVFSPNLASARRQHVLLQRVGGQPRGRVPGDLYIAESEPVCRLDQVVHNSRFGMCVAGTVDEVEIGLGPGLV